MMKCRVCKFRTLKVEEIRDDKGRVVMIRHHCTKCGHIEKEQVV